MTDHDRPVPDPYDHPDVTALLAAEPAPPMPDDVAARLQAALREESDARSARDRPRVVTPIEAARRRRRVVPALAAAAVVVGVVAVGGTALVRSGNGAGNESSDSSAAGSAADSEAPSEPGALAAPESEPGAGADEGRRLADAQEAVDTDQAPAALASRPGALTCTDDQLDVASRLAVSYQGALAWLVTVPADGADDREYVVYGCRGDDAQRLTVLRPGG